MGSSVLSRDLLPFLVPFEIPLIPARAKKFQILQIHEYPGHPRMYFNEKLIKYSHILKVHRFKKIDEIFSEKKLP